MKEGFLQKAACQLTAVRNLSALSKATPLACVEGEKNMI